MLAVMGLAFLLVVILAGLALWQGSRDARLNIEARARSAAYVASSQVRWMIEANLQALRRVSEAVANAQKEAVAELREPGRQPALDLNDIVGALPGAVSIWAFDRDGNSIFSNAAEAAPEFVGDRDEFRAVREGAGWSIGPLMIATPAGTAFSIIRRIELNGEFIGAAMTYVPARLLSDFWRSMGLGPGSTVGLLRRDGWLVARYPVPDAPLNLASYVLFTDHLPRASEGVYEAAASPADGMARIVAYRTIEGLPLVTVVGVPMEAVSADVAQRAGQVGLAAIPILVCLLLASPWAVILLRRETRAREALAVALDQNRTLFREIHHRVKNNLQTVSALVGLQPGPAEAKEDLQRRIAAMAAVHELIYKSDQYDRIELSDYIRRIVAGVQEANSGGVTVDCRLAALTMDIDRALPLGLIVNEVVSNAFKHGFPDGRGGRIEVTLEVADGQARLRIADNGVGQQAPSDGGMGLKLVKALAVQVGGSYRFTAKGGLAFEMQFPIGSVPGRASPAAA